MGWHWLSWFGALDCDEIPGRRLANRPPRGKRASIKAGRKAARTNRRR